METSLNALFRDLDLPWWALSLVVVGVLLLVVLVVRIRRSASLEELGRGWLGASLAVAVAISAVTVEVLTLVRGGGATTVSWELFPEISRFAAAVERQGFGYAFAEGSAVWDVAANLLLLTPLVFFACLRFPGMRRLWAATLVSVVLATLVEILQYVMNSGRVSSPGDAVYIALGGLLGWAWAAAVLLNLGARQPCPTGEIGTEVIPAHRPG